MEDEGRRREGSGHQRRQQDEEEEIDGPRSSFLKRRREMQLRPEDYRMGDEFEERRRRKYEAQAWDREITDEMVSKFSGAIDEGQGTEGGGGDEGGRRTDGSGSGDSVRSGRRKVEDDGGHTNVGDDGASLWGREVAQVAVQGFERMGRSRAGNGEVVDPGGSRDSMGARKALLERLRELSEEQKMKKRRTEESAGEDAAHGEAGEATFRCKRGRAADKVDGEEAKRGRTAAEEGVEQGRKCYHHPPRGCWRRGRMEVRRK